MARLPAVDHVTSLRAIAAEVAQRLAEQFAPTTIWLYGSVARGTVHEDSDIDLLVVMPFTGSAIKLASQMRGACPVTVAMDLRVCTPEEFQRRVTEEHSFYLDILDEGILLYES